jgi:hypothetical protein
VSKLLKRLRKRGELIETDDDRGLPPELLPEGGSVNEMPRRKRSKSERRARKAVRACGQKWKSLPKPVRKQLIADAKTARTLEKMLGVQPAPVTPAASPAATPAAPDAALSKVVFGASVSPEQARDAAAAIRRALQRGTPGVSGWRP